MSKSLLSWVLGAAAMLALPVASFAGGGGHGGGGGGGHAGGGGGGHAGGGGVGHVGGGGFRGGAIRYGNYGNFRGGYGYGGIGIGLGLYPGYGYGYGGYGYDNGYDYPYYSGAYYDTPTYSYVQPYAGMSYYYAPPAQAVVPPAQQTDPNAVTVDVRVPPGAEVWFGGTKTQQTGTDRVFVSPPIEPGQTYSYEIKARWMQDGKPVEQMRKVDVHAGQRVPVDFLRPQN